MTYSLPITSSYRRPIFQALTLQVPVGLFSLMILDGGDCARMCGIALLAFWGGAAVLIWRRPQTPAKTDLALIRLGYGLVVAMAFVLVPAIWAARKSW
jgi:hypothetical protein